MQTTRLPSDLSHSLPHGLSGLVGAMPRSSSFCIRTAHRSRRRAASASRARSHARDAPLSRPRKSRHASACSDCLSARRAGAPFVCPFEPQFFRGGTPSVVFIFRGHGSRNPNRLRFEIHFSTIFRHAAQLNHAISWRSIQLGCAKGFAKPHLPHR